MALSNKTSAERCRQMMATLRHAGEGGVSRQDASKACGLRPSRGIEILRLLRDKGQAECVGHSSLARWYVAGTNSPEVMAKQTKQTKQNEPKAPRPKEPADEDWRGEDDPLVTTPVIHRRISATDAPRIQRTKPYSVFTLAAA